MCGRSIFDVDNIDIGPERRAYLENSMERLWEINGQVGVREPAPHQFIMHTRTHTAMF